MSQLELGPLEENPVLKTPKEVDEERAAYEQSLNGDGPVEDDPSDPVIEDEFVDPMDLYPAEDAPRSMDSERAPIAPATNDQLAAAAEFLAKATGEGVSTETVQSILNSRMSFSAVDEFLVEVEGAEEEQRKSAILAAIATPGIGVEAKLRLIRSISEARDIDINAPQRQVLHHAILEDAKEEAEPDAAYQEHVTNEVRDISPNIEPPTGEDGKPLSVMDELKDMFATAEKDMGIKDIAELFVPGASLWMFNGVVARVRKKLGVTKKDTVNMTSWLQLGTALTELRQMAEQASPEQKDRMAQVLMEELKQNGGVIQDTNDIVALHLMSNIFHEDLYGKTYAPSDKEREALKAKWEALKDVQYPTKDQRKEMRALKARFNAGKTEPILDNAFNILDIAGVVGMARGTIKFGAKTGSRMFDRLSNTAPRSAARNAVDALTDSKEAAKLGMSPSELAEQFFPSAVGKDGNRDIMRGVNGVAEMTARQQDAAAVKLRQSRASNLRPEEQARAVQEIRNEVGGLFSKPLPKLHLHQSDIAITDDGTGVAIDAIFGKTPHRGYGTLGEAKAAKKDAVEAIFGYDAPVEIVMRKRGKFVRVSDDMKDTTRGEFFQRAGDIRHVDSAGNTFGAITLADDSIDNLYLGSAVSMWTRGLNILDNFHVNMISTRVREQKAMESAFRGDFRKLADLSDLNKQRLSRVIIDNEGRELGDRKLQRIFQGDKKLIDAYKDFRFIDNTMYAIEDQKVINAYRREGLQDIRIGDKRFGFGRAVENADDIVGKSVFDPATGITKRLSKQEYEAAIKGGDSFAAMKYDIHGEKGVLAKIVKLNKDTNPRMLPIPATGVLPRIKGHFPHIFKYNFIVKQLDSNGTSRAVKGALTRTDAEQFVKANPGKGYHIVDDAALNSIDSYAQHLDELSTNRSGLLFGKRSDADLENLSPWAESSQVDPIEALFRGSEILSASSTKGDMLQSMRVRLFNYLHSGEAAGIIDSQVLRSKGAMGLSLADFGSATKHNPMVYNKAKAYMRRIDMLERSPDALRRGKKALYKGLAHMAYMGAQKLTKGKGSRGLEHSLLEGARKGIDPISMFMGWMHRNYIAIMAPKQMVLQAAQSMVAGAISPTNYMRAWRQFAGVSAAVSMRMNTLHGAKFGIKALDKDVTVAGLKTITGMSDDEFRGIVRLITESGLVDAVSHNTMIREAVGEAAQRAARRGATIPTSGVAEGASRLGHGAVRTLDLPFQAGSKYGFEAGENMNQILSLLTLYNRDKARGVAKLGSRAYQDDLIGRTSVITGNMVSEAGYAYSRSIIKPMMQWLPFQHSMMLMAIPKGMGGAKTFTAVDKAKIVATQYALFGAKSTVLITLAHKAIEQKLVEKWESDDSLPEGKRREFVNWWRSEPVSKAMEGFISDYIGNKVMQALFGEEHPNDPMDFAWGNSFAPGAGSEFMADKLWAIGTLDTEGMLGVQGQYAGRVMDYIRTVRDVVTARRAELDSMELPDRLAKMTELGAHSLFPVYGKYVLGRWANENEAYISAGGTIGEGYQNEVEVWLSTIMGVDTKDKESYYAARARLGQDFNDEKKMGKAARDAADRYWENLVLTAVKFQREAPSDDIYNMLLNEHMMTHGLVLSALPEADYELFQDHIEQKLERVYKGEGTTSEQIFLEGLNKKLAEGGMGSEGPSIYSYLKHLDFIKNNPEHATALSAAWDELINTDPEPEGAIQ